MENKISGYKDVWICYKDDSEAVVSGFVELIEQNTQYLKFRNNKNIITIPYNRLIKLKERGENG